MLGDAFNKLSAAQSLTATGVSTNVIDLLARKDVGPGACLAFAFTVDVTPVPSYNATAVTFDNTTDIFTQAAHGMSVGDIVTLDGTTVPTGLEFGRDYYITNPTANTYQLSTTLAIAKSGVADGLGTANGTAVTVTGHPTVDFQLVYGDLSTLAETNRPLQVIGSSSPLRLRMPHRTTATAATDILTTTAHGLETGMPVTFSKTGGGAVPAGITEGQVYYAIAASTSTFKIALTPQDALAGNAVDITGAGTAPFYWTVADYALVAAKTLVNVEINPSNELFIPNRYFGARYVISGKLSTGISVSAMPVLDEAYPLSPRLYPSGFTV